MLGNTVNPSFEQRTTSARKFVPLRTKVASAPKSIFRLTECIIDSISLALIICRDFDPIKLFHPCYSPVSRIVAEYALINEISISSGIHFFFFLFFPPFFFFLGEKEADEKLVFAVFVHRE